MLSRETPAAKARGSNSPYPAVRSRNVDAEALGRSPYDRNAKLGGQMGDNVSSDQEGPGAQGEGSISGARDPVRQVTFRRVSVKESDKASNEGKLVVTREEEDGPTSYWVSDAVMNDQEYASVGSRMEEDGTLTVSLEPATGEEEEMDEDEEEEDQDDEVGEEDLDPGNSTQHHMALMEQFDKQDVGNVAFDPDPVTRDEYLRLGQGGATIAAGNYEGVIEDRIKTLTELTQDGFRYPPHLAKRLQSGEFVSFEDEEERDAVLRAFRTHDVMSPYPKLQKTEKSAAEMKPRNKFAPLSEASQKVMLDKLVRGKYGDMKATPYKHDILNHVARSTLQNGTYLSEDGNKFLKKVQSLLPAQVVARPPPQKRAGARK